MGKDADVYFEIGKMNSKKTDADPGLEKDVPDWMETAANKAVKSKKGVTSKEPKDKKEGGYIFSGTLEKLTKEPKGSEAEMACALNMVLLGWPKKNLLSASITQSARMNVSLDQNEKQLAKDAEFLVADATTKITEKTIDYVLKNRP
jgi:hypothetical protein